MTVVSKTVDDNLVQRDVRLGMYAPEDGGVNDHCIVRAEDGWHYFFIYREYEKWDGKGVTAGANIGHAFSTDMFEWKSCPIALEPLKGSWDSHYVWAPSVIRRGPYWYMAYAGVDTVDKVRGAQRLGIVRSKDLYHWERFHDTCVLDASEFTWFDKNVSNDLHYCYDCRDPFLYDAGDETVMYYTARAGDDEPCIAAARSRDMVHWEDLGPVVRMYYGGDDMYRAGAWTPLESCCVFERQGLWYLVYQLSGIRYHVSRDPFNWHGTRAQTFSTNMWLFRWADVERDIHIYKTQSFFGVLRFGRVKWEGECMVPGHGMNEDTTS